MNIVRHFRGSRGSRRSGGIRQVIQSYKMIIEAAAASFAANANQQFPIVEGLDGKVAGQTSSVDDQVPVGCVIKSIRIWYCQQNLVNVAGFTHLTLQHLRTGQSFIAADDQAGNPQRNQVHHTDYFSVGQNQNVNRGMLFKIPAKYQRVRDGDKWQLIGKSGIIL